MSQNRLASSSAHQVHVMTISNSAAFTAAVLLVSSGSAGAATSPNTVSAEVWMILVLVALACVVALVGLWMLMARRRRAKALTAVIVGARERSLQRHTERQRLATQFSDLGL